MSISKVLFGLTLALPGTAFAQTSTTAVITPPLAIVANQAATPVVPTPAATIVTSANPELMILRAGVSVPLKLMEELTTKGKKLRVGQRFQMEVAENVMLGSVVVIPAGSPAVGEVTDVRNKGMWGRSGKLNARALYARVNGRQIRLTGQIDEKGTAGGIGAVAVSGLVFLPAGFFMTGRSANLPMGTPLVAFLDEDIQLSTAPLTVVVVQPAAAPPIPAPR
jgi:hypothetical protein